MKEPADALVPVDAALVPRQAPIPGRSTAPLDAKDEALDPLLRALLDARQLPNINRATLGLRLPFRSLGFLVKQSSLWSIAIWPVLINISLFALGVYMVWGYVGGLVELIWIKPVVTAWHQSLMLVLWWVLNSLAHIVALVMVYISVTILGGIVASPFNDIISERTERLLLGDRYVKGDEIPLIPSVLSSLRSTTIIALMYLGCLLPLLPLHLIPGIGSLAYTLIAGGVGAYFITMEYNDILLERKGFRMKAKFGRVWEERSLTLGFGAGTNLLLAIPLLNFMCIPLAVIGGTAMGLCLEQWELYPQLSDDSSPPKL